MIGWSDENAKQYEDENAKQYEDENAKQYEDENAKQYEDENAKQYVLERRSRAFELIARTCASGRGGPLGVQPEGLTTSAIARLRPHARRVGVGASSFAVRLLIKLIYVFRRLKRSFLYYEAKKNPPVL